MKNIEPSIGSLIEELRLRILQLQITKDEDFLKVTEELGRWIFDRFELEEAIRYIDKTQQQQIATITSIGRALEDELSKEWKVVLSYKVDLNKLDDTGKFYFQQLKKTFNNEINLDLQDAYHYFRILNMQLFSIKSLNKKIVSGKKITMNNNGEIREFVPISTQKAWLEVRQASDLFNDQRENNPQGTIAHLRLLTQFKDEYEWRNKFNNWGEIYGKDYYLPRLNQLSNFFYDFYFLNIKPSLDSDIINKLEIKYIKYLFNKTSLIIKPDFGFIEFDSEKSTKNHLMGKFIEILINNLNGIEIKQFENIEKDLNNNLVSAYRTTLNTRFNKEFEKGKTKVFLYIDSTREGKSNTRYALKAYRFSLFKNNPS